MFAINFLWQNVISSLQSATYFCEAPSMGMEAKKKNFICKVSNPFWIISCLTGLESTNQVNLLLSIC